MSDDLPEPDRIEGAPHPRETQTVFGQAQAEAEFLEAFNSGRMHSGWMITGPRGVGKATLAYKIAGFLLADQPDQGGGLFGDTPPAATSLALDAEHPDMRLMLAESHPRLSVIRRPVNPDTGKLRTEITAEPVRALKKFFQMTSADGGRRVVIVDVADEMNVSAANSILKELEEPPALTTILLLAHQPSALLPTIRSRCRVLRCNTLGPDDMSAALTQAGITIPETEAITALAGGSVGEAIRLVNLDGLKLYADLVQLFDGLPNMPRPAALRLAESCVGKAGEQRFPLMIDLIDTFLARAARAGLLGQPQTQGAPGEARLLARLAPHDVAARKWATLQQDISARTRRGRAVNLDPAALILDMLFKIEETARSAAAT